MRLVISFFIFLLLLSCSDGKSKVGDEDSLTDDDTETDDISQVDDEESDTTINDSDEDVDNEEIFPDFEENCGYFKAECGKLATSSGELDCGKCPEEMTCGLKNIKNQCVKEVCKYGYCWVNPYPTGDPVVSGDLIENGDLFFVTEANVYYKKGSLFDIIPHQLRSGGTFSSVIAFDENNIWASATDGSLLKYDKGFISCLDDDGEYYSPVKSGIYSLSGKSASDIYAAGRDGLLHYDGTYWTVEFETAAKMISVMVSENRVFAGGENLLAVKKDVWKVLSISGNAESIAVVDDTSAAVLIKKEGIPQKITVFDEELKIISETELDDSDYSAISYYKGSIIAGGKNGTINVDGTVINFDLPWDIKSFKVHDGTLHIFGTSGLMASWDGEKLSSNKGFFNNKAASVFATSPSSIFVSAGTMIIQILPNTVNYFPLADQIEDIFGKSENEIYAKTKGDLFKYNGFAIRKVKDPATVDTAGMISERNKFMTKTDDSVSWKFNDELTFEYSCITESCIVTLADKNEVLNKIMTFPNDGISGIPVGSRFATDSFIAAGGDAVYTIKDGITDSKYYDFDITSIDADNSSVLLGTSDGKVHVVKNDSIENSFDLGTGSPVTSVSINDSGHIAALSNGFIYLKTDNDFENIPILSGKKINSLWLFDDDSFIASGEDVVLEYDGNMMVANLPKDLIDRGLPTGETQVNMHRIFALDPDNIWILGSSPDGKTAYIFSFDGTKWINDARSSLYDEYSFTDVWACDQNNVLISMDSEGWIYHYKNMTTQGFIESVDNPLGEPVYSMAADPQGDLYIFGHDGIVLRSSSPCVAGTF